MNQTRNKEVAPAEPAPVWRSISGPIWMLFVMGLLVGAVIVALNRPAQNPTPTSSALPTPAQLAQAKRDIPRVPFTDITTAAGIRFVQNNGAYGEKLLPETMGGGVAFFDFDNDGRQDLFFVNSTWWPWATPPGAIPTPMALYRNRGGAQFEEVTAHSGLDVGFYGMGVAAGDFDNDGWVDLFITGVGENKLLRNLGDGKFSDVTAGAAIKQKPSQWGTSCAWVDYDNDGRLDLFICNYVEWSRQIDAAVNYQLPGVGRAYGPPLNFPPTFPTLYRNEGSGRFSDVTESSGVHVRKPTTDQPMAKSLGVAPIDLNTDGWIDLIVANDTVQNFVFTNQHNGTFKEVGAISGIAFDPFGGTRGAMGIDAARFQNNNNVAVAIGNFANEMTALYVSQQDPLLFSDEAINQGIGTASRDLLTFGVFFFDYDLDGWLDLLTANGHIEEAMAKVRPNQQYRQPAQLYWNARGTRSGAGFVVVPPEKSGRDLVKPLVGRGSAYADIDDDGDLDVVLAQIAGPPLLLRNDQALGHHWIRLKLVGAKCNRDAIGAWIRVQAGSAILSRQVMPTRGYLSQSELPVTIGLGNRARVDDVTVYWPDGSSQKVPNVALDSLTVVTQK